MNDQAIHREWTYEDRKAATLKVQITGSYFHAHPTARSARIILVRIFTLAIAALVLCSCADAKRAADGDRDGFGHGYVSGSGDPT